MLVPSLLLLLSQSQAFDGRMGKLAPPGFEDGTTQGSPPPPSPVVTLPSGQVQGYLLGNASVYLGLPFAAPPVEQLRFRAPAPPLPWTGVRPAVAFGPACPQAKLAVARGDGSGGLFPPEDEVSPPPQSEDCLFLNVFSANMVKGSPKQPVMVWIHGGAFIEGWAGSYRPSGVVANLVSRGVVVVTLQYRLNIFGFFTAPAASGLAPNAGMLDQVAALQWVQANIGLFGGDAGDVTIFGESAGAASVSLHLYSPLSRGLFHKAAMQSGTAFCPWSVDGGWNYEWPYSKEVSRALDCASADEWAVGAVAGLGSCLRRPSWESLLAVSDSAVRIPEGLCCGWSPVVDGPGGFLPDWPRNLAAQRPSNIPVLLGNNHDEMYYFLKKLFEGAVGMNFFGKGSFYFELILATGQKLWGPLGGEEGPMAELLKFAYVDGVPNPPGDEDHFYWLNVSENFEGGHFFFAPTMLEVAESLKTTSSVYLYSLDYISSAYPWPKFQNQPINGSFHSWDLYFLFRWDFAWTWNAQDRALSEEMGRRWTNFAKSGDPNRPAPVSTQWTPTAGAYPQETFLSLDSTLKMSHSFHRREVSLWLDAVPRLITKGLPGPAPTFPGNSLPFTLPPATPSRFPVDHCASSPCANGATCASFPQGAFCHCPPAFTGQNCSVAVADTECVLMLSNDVVGGVLRVQYSVHPNSGGLASPLMVGPGGARFLHAVQRTPLSATLLPSGARARLDLGSCGRNGVQKIRCQGNYAGIRCEAGDP